MIVDTADFDNGVWDTENLWGLNDMNLREENWSDRSESWHQMWVMTILVDVVDVVDVGEIASVMSYY